jgi:hypothetical protein
MYERKDIPSLNPEAYQGRARVLEALYDAVGSYCTAETHPEIIRALQEAALVIEGGRVVVADQGESLSSVAHAHLAAIQKRTTIQRGPCDDGKPHDWVRRWSTRGDYLACSKCGRQ